jgi:hypothetical protein
MYYDGETVESDVGDRRSEVYQGKGFGNYFYSFKNKANELWFE